MIANVLLLKDDAIKRNEREVILRFVFEEKNVQMQKMKSWRGSISDPPAGTFGVGGYTKTPKPNERARARAPARKSKLELVERKAKQQSNHG
jgi:hypothetical protein